MVEIQLVESNNFIYLDVLLLNTFFHFLDRRLRE